MNYSAKKALTLSVVKERFLITNEYVLPILKYTPGCEGSPTAIGLTTEFDEVSALA
jgi:hypothetical protein